jgi:hypothetical protein
MKSPDMFIFLLLAIFGFMIWNRTSGKEMFTDVSASNSVDPATIQTIVNGIQDRIPDLYPLQTVYINPMQGDQGSVIYNARILFLNTRGYFGVQYDVQADSAGNLISVTGQVQPQANGPFQGFNETNDVYRDFDSIEAVLEEQFANLKQNIPGVSEKLDSWLDTQRLQQRGRAFADAQSNSMPAGSTDSLIERSIVA